jgi:predicted Zn-dependent protease
MMGPEEDDMKDLPAAAAARYLCGLYVGLGLTFSVGGGVSVSVAQAAPPRGSLSDSALEPAARAAADSHEWSTAEELYRELVRRQPRNAAARRGLGIVLMRQDKGELANGVLTESLDLQDSAETRVSLAENFMAMNRYPSALPHLRRAVAMSPDGVAGWVELAAVLVKVDKPDSAADVLRESARVCKRCRDDAGWRQATNDAARALALRAQKEVQAGNAAAAGKTLGQATALSPGLPETHLVLAQLARNEGDEPRAVAEFRKVVDTSPDAHAEPGATARLELARLLTEHGRGAEAATLAQQVVASRGEDVTNLDVLGRACDASKDTDCARRAYGRLIKLPLGSRAESDDETRSRTAVTHARDRLKALKSHGRKRRK